MASNNSTSTAKTHVSLRLPSYLLESIDAYAERENISRTEAFVFYLQTGLDISEEKANEPSPDEARLMSIQDELAEIKALLKGGAAVSAGAGVAAIIPESIVDSAAPSADPQPNYATAPTFEPTVEPTTEPEVEPAEDDFTTSDEISDPVVSDVAETAEDIEGENNEEQPFASLDPYAPKPETAEEDKEAEEVEPAKDDFTTSDAVYVSPWTSLTQAAGQSENDYNEAESKASATEEAEGAEDSEDAVAAYAVTEEAERSIEASPASSLVSDSVVSGVAEEISVGSIVAEEIVETEEAEVAEAEEAEVTEVESEFSDSDEAEDLTSDEAEEANEEASTTGEPLETLSDYYAEEAEKDSHVSEAEVDVEEAEIDYVEDISDEDDEDNNEVDEDDYSDEDDDDFGDEGDTEEDENYSGDHDSFGDLDEPSEDDFEDDLEDDFNENESEENFDEDDDEEEDFDEDDDDEEDEEDLEDLDDSAAYNESVFVEEDEEEFDIDGLDGLDDIDDIDNFDDLDDDDFDDLDDDDFEDEDEDDEVEDNFTQPSEYVVVDSAAATYVAGVEEDYIEGPIEIEEVDGEEAEDIAEPAGTTETYEPNIYVAPSVGLIDEHEEEFDLNDIEDINDTSFGQESEEVLEEADEIIDDAGYVEDEYEDEDDIEDVFDEPLPLADLKNITALVAGQFPAIEKVWLFGNAATGAAIEQPILDICLKSVDDKKFKAKYEEDFIAAMTEKTGKVINLVLRSNLSKPGKQLWKATRIELFRD